jgi:hypothetical protein
MHYDFSIRCSGSLNSLVVLGEVLHKTYMLRAVDLLYLERIYEIALEDDNSIDFKTIPLLQVDKRPIYNKYQFVQWSGWADLNRRPPEPHSGALPGCATPRHQCLHFDLFTEISQGLSPAGLEDAGGYR